MISCTAARLRRFCSASNWFASSRSPGSNSVGPSASSAARRSSKSGCGSSGVMGRILTNCPSHSSGIGSSISTRPCLTRARIMVVSRESRLLSLMRSADDYITPLLAVARARCAETSLPAASSPSRQTATPALRPLPSGAGASALPPPAPATPTIPPIPAYSE